VKYLTPSSLLLCFLLSACDSKPTAKPPAEPSGTTTSVTDIPKQVTFNAHIRPIFSDTCFACHGFDAKHREADLRLDTPEGAYAKLKDSNEHAIVPGKPEESAILKRLFSTDPEEIMPPPDFHKPFTERQKKLVQAWVAQGAKYEEHWAFTPITKPSVPTLAANQDRVVNPIDSFILSNLASEKITPSPLADRATLLRRLSLDLTGLPPSPSELAAFVADTQPDAYSKQVERLLASPRYGERMAIPWLDIVRFADTVGYHGDQNANVFPYRDYVIKSFNDNKPFDQFTTEQLAGDLLKNPTDEQRIATGFLRLNLMTREGGAQPKEYLAKYMGDRVRAVGAAWLGLTTGCAECHDHKFDPITAKDYYSLGAFFADVQQWGVYAYYGSSPEKELRGVNNDSPFPPEICSKNQALQDRLHSLQDAGVNVLADLKKPENDSAIQQWSASQAKFLSENPSAWQILTPAAVTAAKGTAFAITPEKAVLFTGPVVKDEKLTIRLPLTDMAIRSIRLEILPDAKNANRVGRSPLGKFTVTPTFSILPAAAPSQPLKIAWSQADRRTPQKYKNGESSPLLEPAWQSAPALMEMPQDAAALPHHALYHLAATHQATAGQVLEISLATADLGKIRVSVTPFGDSVPGDKSAIRPDLASALQAPTASRSGPHQRELAAAWMLSTVPDAALPTSYLDLRQSITACRAGFANSLISQPVTADRILPTHILPRGAWMNPGEEVQPAVPNFLPHASIRKDGTRLTRLDLAKWLMAPENPLPARQFTNRLWKQFFGKGLSNVLDDLGNQGEWPSHPQLLDWLAVEFRESGWDVKHMVRLMVSSQTYRQVSASRPDLAERDPDNRLLAEQSARRLDAEFIRDNALSISGLLTASSIGGPSVKPYQPAGYYQNLNFPERDYPASTGPDQYRRGLYMHWQRTFMHPMLAGFDAPSRELCTADRFMSNSPQQALTLLNDPTFVEAARGFALRLDHEKPGATDEEKIQHAMQLALARAAKPDELPSLIEFLKSQRRDYLAKPEDAASFLKVGLSDPGTGKAPAELAAWTQLCRVILNLHETITRY
jgi:hypothetical protein